MTREDVLKNLNSLEGKEYKPSKIIEAFKGYSEYGKEEIIIEETKYLGAIAHINVEKPTIFWILTENGEISEVVMYDYYEFYIEMLTNYWKLDGADVLPEYFINEFIEKECKYRLEKLLQRCKNLSSEMLTKIHDKLND